MRSFLFLPFIKMWLWHFQYFLSSVTESKRKEKNPVTLGWWDHVFLRYRYNVTNFLILFYFQFDRLNNISRHWNLLYFRLIFSNTIQLRAETLESTAILILQKKSSFYHLPVSKKKSPVSISFLYVSSILERWVQKSMNSIL